MTETISLELLDDLRRKNSALELLRLLAMAANEVGSSRRIYQEAVDRVCAHTTWPVGHVLVAEEDDQVLDDSGVWHLDDPDGFGVLRQASAELRFRAGEGLPGRVLASGEPLWIRDVTEDREFLRNRVVADLGVRGGFAFPVLVGEDVAAVLEFFGREPAEPDRELLDLMTDVGAILGRVVERERWEREITLREEQLAAAQQIARMGSWAWDVARDRIEWSDQLYRIYGLEPGTPIDFETYLAHHHPDDRDRVRDTVERAIEGGHSFSVEHRILRPDGEVRVIHGLGEAERDEDGRTLRMTGTAQDVTERKEAEGRERELLREHVREQLARARAEAEAEELARLTRELERSNAELDQFAYVASHDLKAPLRGISNLSQWLAEDLADRLTDDTREYVELLQGRIQRMEDLIDGLLSYSRAGRLREEPEPVDVGELAREALDLLDPPDDLELTLQPDLPTLVTERLPLQQVFHNLLSNAVKYGPEEGARIEVAGRQENGAWEFSVRDNGPGIGPRYHDRIWGMFQILRPRDEVEGTGIGLALVKKIVGSRGGRVGVESQEAAGARFWFTWPEALPAPSEAAMEER